MPITCNLLWNNCVLTVLCTSKRNPNSPIVLARQFKSLVLRTKSGFNILSKIMETIYQINSKNAMPLSAKKDQQKNTYRIKAKAFCLRTLLNMNTRKQQHKLTCRLQHMKQKQMYTLVSMSVLPKHILIHLNYLLISLLSLKWVSGVHMVRCISIISMILI